MARGAVRTFGGRKRRMSWFNGPGGTAVTQLTATGSSLMGSTVTPAAGQEDGTIVRTRGLFDAFIEQTPAADGDGYFGAVGIGVASLAAVSAGIGSLPTPITEISWDGWLWHSFFSVHVPDIAFAPSSASQQRIEIDSKAMRKFETLMSVYMAVEIVETGGAILNLRGFTRQLCKLA